MLRPSVMCQKIIESGRGHTSAIINPLLFLAACVATNVPKYSGERKLLADVLRNHIIVRMRSKLLIFGCKFYSVHHCIKENFVRKFHIHEYYNYLASLSVVSVISPESSRVAR